MIVSSTFRLSEMSWVNQRATSEPHRQQANHDDPECIGCSTLNPSRPSRPTQSTIGLVGHKLRSQVVPICAGLWQHPMTIVWWRLNSPGGELERVILWQLSPDPVENLVEDFLGRQSNGLHLGLGWGPGLRLLLVVRIWILSRAFPVIRPVQLFLNLPLSCHLRKTDQRSPKGVRRSSDWALKLSMNAFLLSKLRLTVGQKSNLNTEKLQKHERLQRGFVFQQSINNQVLNAKVCKRLCFAWRQTY